MANYYTSDLHLNHEKILSLCQRPFQSVDEMNHVLIRNINATCSPEDTLYILGDVGKDNVVELLKQIHCKKILIVGNRDNIQLKHPSFVRCFQKVRSTVVVVDDGYHIALSHYPMAEWDGFWRGNYHFYGHVHNNNIGGSSLMDLLPNAVNVGVDVQDFLPKTARELIEHRKATYQAPDSVKSFLKESVFAGTEHRHNRTADFSGIFSQDV